MARITFGTDGWRAVIADDFNFANVARVAQAAADFWKSELSNQESEIFGRNLKVVVGYDRRFFSERFAQIAADVFAGNRFQVILTAEPAPTPSVSFAVKHLNAVGGVMITASHNPPIFNGFKLKSHYGGPTSSDECKAVESFLGGNRPQVGLSRRDDAGGRPQGPAQRAPLPAFGRPRPAKRGEGRGEGCV